MKAKSFIEVIKSKKQRLQLFLDRTHTLVLRASFLRARSGASKIARPKNRVGGTKFVQA